MKSISLEENSKRVDYLDELYKLDGRDKKDHPKAGLFTGLHQEILTYERLCEELAIYEKWKSRGYPDAPRAQ